MMRSLTLAIILSVFMGCSSPAVRYTSEEIKGFPPEIQQKVIKGEVSTGMTPQQVRYAWHAPKGVQTTKTKDNKLVELWNYSIMGACPITLYFSEGKLYSIVLAEGSKTSEIRYTQEEIKAYPEEIRQYIINAQIVTGMTPQQVRNSWGSPEGVSSYKDADGKSKEEWVYASSALCKVALVFTEGKLSGVLRTEGIGR
jgi:outer membrane protein assembly factor BamE (lipoprotein component of BamABCDE complex)